MKIAIDLDHTITCEHGDSLRPGILNFLEDLIVEGHSLILWTSSTKQRGESILKELGLKGYFDAFIYREDYDPENTGKAKDLSSDAGAGIQIIIDDHPLHANHPNSLPGKSGFLVRQYYSVSAFNEDDFIEELEVLLESIRSISHQKGEE